MTEHRHYSGPDLAPLLRQLRDELGSDAEILRAERIRSGGLAGFFAREHYEVVAKRPEADSSARPTSSTAVVPTAVTPVAVTPAAVTPVAVTPAAVTPDEIDEPIAAEPFASGTVADELIAGRPNRLPEHSGRAASAGTEPTSSPAPTSTSADPGRTQPAVAAGGSGRSIQAALLDRADRVSTEELLVRVAETHSADWGAESFHSILGRAMVDAVGPTVDAGVDSSLDSSSNTGSDTTSIDEDHGDNRRTEARLERRSDSIGGLRLEPIRPGEKIIDPVPQAPTPDVPTNEQQARRIDDDQQPQRTTLPADVDEGLRALAQDRIPPQWANGVAPQWSPPWMQAWSPWMAGWPVPTPGESRVAIGVSHLCANCADPVPPTDDAADADDGRPAGAADRDTAPETVVEPSWSELKREIDDVRHLLDDIVGTLHRAVGEGGAGDHTTSGFGSDDDLGGQPPPDRRRTPVNGW